MNVFFHCNGPVWLCCVRQKYHLVVHMKQNIYTFKGFFSSQCSCQSPVFFLFVLFVLRNSNSATDLNCVCPFLSPLHVTQEGLWLWTPAVTSAVWMECRSPCPRRSHRVSEFTHIFAFSAICASLWCIATYWWPIRMSDKTIGISFRNYLQTHTLCSNMTYFSVPLNLYLLFFAVYGKCQTCPCSGEHLRPYLVSTVSMCAHKQATFQGFFVLSPASTCLQTCEEIKQSDLLCLRLNFPDIFSLKKKERIESRPA